MLTFKNFGVVLGLHLKWEGRAIGLLSKQALLTELLSLDWPIGRSQLWKFYVKLGIMLKSGEISKFESP